MSNITRVGVDLAKNLIQVHAVNAAGKVVTNRTLKREKFLAWCAELLPGCIVAMGACGTGLECMVAKREGFRSLATWWDEANRYQQIKRYAGRAGLANWVAIDDQAEGWGADDLDKLVHTNGETGLSDPVVLALLAARLQGLRKSEAC